MRDVKPIIINECQWDGGPGLVVPGAPISVRAADAGWNKNIFGRVRITATPAGEKIKGRLFATKVPESVPVSELTDGDIVLAADLPPMEVYTSVSSGWLILGSLGRVEHVAEYMCNPWVSALVTRHVPAVSCVLDWNYSPSSAHMIEYLVAGQLIDAKWPRGVMFRLKTSLLEGL